MNILGHPITFKKKRYGNSATGTTYTWATIDLDGRPVRLGDFTAKTPVTVLEAAVSAALLAHRDRHGEAVQS